MRQCSLCFNERVFSSSQNLGSRPSQRACSCYVPTQLVASKQGLKVVLKKAQRVDNECCTEGLILQGDCLSQKFQSRGVTVLGACLLNVGFDGGGEVRITPQLQIRVRIGHASSS